MSSLDDVSSLERALNLFNKRDDDSSQLAIKRDDDPMSSSDYVEQASKIKWRRPSPPPSSSMQPVDEDGTASDLWRMHSLHSTLNNSENLEETTAFVDATKRPQVKPTKEAKLRLSPIPAPSATYSPLDRFQHLASAKS